MALPQPRHLAWALFLRPLAITSTARQLTPTNGSPCNWDPRGCSCKPTGISKYLGEDPALWAWAATYGSYTQSWELTLELNLGNVILSQDGSQLRVGVSLGARDSLQVSSEAPANLLELGLGLRRIAGQTYRAFGAQIFTNKAVAAESVALTTNQHANIRVTFDASTKTLATWYEASGGTTLDCCPRTRSTRRHLIGR